MLQRYTFLIWGKLYFFSHDVRKQIVRIEGQMHIYQPLIRFNPLTADLISPLKS